MRKQDPADDLEDSEPLIDTTAALSLRSKRTERQKKRHLIKNAASRKHITLFELPSELLISILGHLLPSDVPTLSLVNRGLHTFILNSRTEIANSITSRRYPILTQCFPLPVLLSNVDQDAHAALLDEERQVKQLHIHKKPYQHVKSSDPKSICTCLTCVHSWNSLCLIVDFAYWQKNLEQGKPIPMIARGEYPQWNQVLVDRNASIVEKALRDKLWYARILEEHLKSTVGSIRRHKKNAGNKRRRFRMTEEDAAKGNDAFLQRSGPPSMDFPYHRDNYYMLEAYLPNRGWDSERDQWVYMPSTQHLTDVGFVKAWAKWRDARRKTESDVKC